MKKKKNCKQIPGYCPSAKQVVEYEDGVHIIIIVFFISSNADGLLLEFELQQVSSSVQDSSQYSG